MRFTLPCSRRRRKTVGLFLHLLPTYVSPGLYCRPSWSLAGVVLIITCGLLLLVAGETKFDMLGFVLVMSASALAGLRWTITQVLLQGNLHHGTERICTFRA